MSTDLGSGRDARDGEGASVAAVLVRAADRLAASGWCRGFDAVDGDGEEADPRSDEAVSFCARGAIASVCSIDALSRRAVEIVTDAVEARYLYEWNDAEERTKDEVVAKLREVAASLA